jgi:hypothetical protein
MAIKYAVSIERGPLDPSVKFLTKKKIHISRRSYASGAWCDLVCHIEDNLVISPAVMRTGLFQPEGMCKVCLRNYSWRWPFVQIPKIYKDFFNLK